MTVQAWALLRVIAAARSQAAARILPVASRSGMKPGTRQASTPSRIAAAWKQSRTKIIKYSIVMEEKKETNNDGLLQVAEAIRQLYEIFPDLNKRALGRALGLPRSCIVKIINGWNFESTWSQDIRLQHQPGRAEAVEIARLQGERDALRYCIRQFTSPGLYHDDSFEG